MILHKAHRRKCLDVCVMRGADYNTYHRMVRAMLVVGRKRAFSRRHEGEFVKRWDISKL